MSESCCRIERHENGYEVSIRDPEIVKKNMSSKNGWRDPDRSYVFADFDKMMEFLKNNLDKALPSGEYETSFAKALQEED